VDASEWVKWLLKELNVWLRPFGFKRRGQTFAREFDTSWQIINVQLSRFSPSGEKSLTINFGVQSKLLMRFRKEDVSKAPLEYRCPIRFRIGFMRDKRDVWWKVHDAPSAQTARREITEVFHTNAISFLDEIKTNDDMIRLFESGQVLGFEIDRDETWLVLLAELGDSAELRERLDDYERRWPLSPAAERASKFLTDLKSTYLALPTYLHSDVEESLYKGRIRDSIPD
jgi:hypothetical protein